MRMGFVIQETTYLPQKVGEVIYLYEPSPSAKLEYECHSLCSCLVKIPGQAGSVDLVIWCLFPSPFPLPPMLPILYVSSQCTFFSNGMPCLLPTHWVSLDILPFVVSWTSLLIYMKIWGIFWSGLNNRFVKGLMNGHWQSCGMSIRRKYLFLIFSHAVWDLSSPTRDQTCVHQIGSRES